MKHPAIRGMLWFAFGATVLAGCAGVPDITSREPQRCEVHGGPMTAQKVALLWGNKGLLFLNREKIRAGFPHHAGPRRAEELGVREGTRVVVRICPQCVRQFEEFKRTVLRPDPNAQAAPTAPAPRTMPKPGTSLPPIPAHFRERGAGKIRILVLGDTKEPGEYHVVAGTSLQDLLCGIGGEAPLIRPGPVTKARLLFARAAPNTGAKKYWFRDLLRASAVELQDGDTVFVEETLDP